MINPFISDHIPEVLWPPLIAEFGLDVDYLSGTDSSNPVTITVLWKEGASDEEISPGRYSHLYVRNADLPAAPALGDAVQKDDKVYDVVRVDAAPYYFSRLVLQETGPIL
jgi:hypothetical protein